MPLKISPLPQYRYRGNEGEEITNYIADRSERVPIEVKQFYKVHGEFKVNITNQLMTIIK